VHVVPRKSVVVESGHAPGAVLSRIAGEVTAQNRRAIVTGTMRLEVAGELVRIGWPFGLGPLNARFEGRITAVEDRTVLIGEVRVLYAALLSVPLLGAFVFPLLQGIEQGHPAVGAFVAVCLFGALRLYTGWHFRWAVRRIERVLLAALEPELPRA
jgi:hypothetical protein